MGQPRDEAENPYAAPESPLGEEPTTRRKWYQASLVEWIVVVVIIALEIGLLLPAVDAARRSARRPRHKP